MNITLGFKKQVIAIIGGAALLFVAASLCGIRRTLFASAPSAFGGLILYIACRHLVASFYERILVGEKNDPAMRSAGAQNAS